MVTQILNPGAHRMVLVLLENLGQRRVKRAKIKARMYEQKQVKYDDLPRLAKKMLAKKRRATPTAA